MGAYFRLNHSDAPEGKWVHLRQRFIAYLLKHQEKWKAIRESNSVAFMSYMVSRFHRLTGLRLMGLETYTSWIKPGSYYHWVVAQKGQLGLCGHLAGLDPP